MNANVDGYCVIDTQTGNLWIAPSAKNKRGKHIWRTRAAAGNAWTCHNHAYSYRKDAVRYTEQSRFVTKGVKFTIVDL